MKYFFYFLAIFFLLAINIGFFGIFPIGRQVPNLLFLFVVIFALDKKNLDFFFVATLGGILLDFYSTSFFGGWTLGFLLAGAFIYSLSENFIFLELNWKTFTFLLFGGLVVLNFILWLYGLLTFKFGWTVSYIELNTFTHEFFTSFLYNWLLLYPMYIFCNWLKDLIENFTIRSRGVVK